MPLHLGAVVDGKYRVVRPLGSGGMGEVWVVEHLMLGSLHALKVNRHGAHALRLLAEARAQAALRHPNVVTVTDLVSVDGAHGIVMELVAGPTLDRWMELHRPTEGEVIDIARGILRGLGAIHRAGLVHRDLKPGNVLLQRDGSSLVPRVSDFGIAMVVQGPRATRTGIHMGTPAYMAPEQARDAKHVDARADLFAFGAMLFEMLAGAPAFRGSVPEILQAVQEGRSSPLPEAVSPALRDIVSRCLAVSPDDRPGSANEVEALLEGLAAEPFGPAALAAAAHEDPPTPEPARSTISASTHDLPRSANCATFLSAERDDFVGRTSDVAALNARIASGARLITVVGPGGVGKSRLCRHVAQLDMARFEEVRVCDLADTRTESGLFHALSAALDLPLQATDLAQQLALALRLRGRCLVILDNFEQIASLAPIVGGWVDAAPLATVVVTSRQVLGIPGEEVFEVHPLDTPEAVELLIRRARAVAPDLEWSDQERAAAEDLVDVLDGLPLAIELAAARTRVLPPSELLARMGDRFRILSGGVGRPARQATLEATLHWSWGSLSPFEQRALAQLSVFEGGFTLEDAEAVLEVDDHWPLDLVQGLVEKSLLRKGSPESTKARRWSFLTSVQEYASGRLTAQERTEVQIRHGARFARWKEVVGAGLPPAEWASGPGFIAESLDNIVAAIHWAIARRDAATAAQCLGAAAPALTVRGLIAHARDLAESTLALSPPGTHEHALALTELVRSMARTGEKPPEELQDGLLALADTPLRSELQLALGLAWLRQGECGLADEAARAVRTAAARWGRPDLAVQATSLGGFVALGLGDVSGAVGALEAALDLGRQAGFSRTVAKLIGDIGTLEGQRGNQERSRQFLREALTLHRAHGDVPGEAATLGNLALVHHSVGELEEAVALLEDAIPRLLHVADARGAAVAHANLAVALLDLGRPTEAWSYAEGAAQLAQEARDAVIEVHARTVASFVLLDQGEVTRGQVLAGDAAGLPGAASPPLRAGLLAAQAAGAARSGDAAAAHALYQQALSLAPEGWSAKGAWPKWALEKAARVVGS